MMSKLCNEKTATEKLRREKGNEESMTKNRDKANAEGKMTKENWSLRNSDEKMATRNGDKYLVKKKNKKKWPRITDDKDRDEETPMEIGDEQSAKNKSLQIRDE